MQGICKLCDNEDELRQSHLIPSFVYKWQKKTSATGYLRYSEEPNKRVQDGFKPYYLCDDCEKKLCQWETAFNNHIFKPINNDKTGPFRYSDWLLKFAVSVSWRNLIFTIDQGELPNELDNQASTALDVWKKFLNEESLHPGEHQQHLVLLGEVMGGTDEVPANINRYILRAIVRGIYFDDSNAYIYTKMGKILLVGFINYHKPKRYWNRSLIRVRNGVLEGDMTDVPPEEIGYFMYKAKSLKIIDSSISLKQRKKIDEDYKKMKKRALKSGTVKATQKDIEIFGKDRVFKKNK
jgi:hypothetical protein